MSPMRSLDSTWAWFRGVKGLYGAVAWILGVGVPAAVSVTTFVTALRADLPLPYIITAAVVTLAAALTIVNQFRAFLGIPFLVTRDPDYSYGLGYGGVYMGVDEGNPDATIQLGVHITNCVGLPMRYAVERFHVSLGNRIVQFPQFVNNGGLLSAGSAHAYKYAPFPEATIKDFLGKRTAGEIEIHIVYGHPEHRIARRLSLKTAVWLNLTPGKFTLAENIMGVADTRI